MPTKEEIEMWKTWDIWDGWTVPTGLTEKINKISICTTCMNRVEDLKKTLVDNIVDNEHYPNIEFVLINYNSKDDLDTYISTQPYLRKMMEAGKFVYAKTTEPKFYSMSHSRNVAYKVASGDIVTNVDADNWAFGKAHHFACRLNHLANQRPSKAVFAKGKRMMHGRIGFYRKEFIELGGYDESMIGYGYDDHDLVCRAMLQGFKLMWFGGHYINRIITSSEDKGKYMEDKNWRKTEKLNRKISEANIAAGKLTANGDRHWGKAHLLVNFEKELDI